MDCDAISDVEMVNAVSGDGFTFGDCVPPYGIPLPPDSYVGLSAA